MTSDCSETLNNVNTYSKPSELRITDMRIGMLQRRPLVKLYTNQGIVGYGEVRDGGDAKYALMLKSRILGENPCNIDKIFRRIKQFGHHARQAGGVCAVEVALWDLAGKAYGVPVYAMLGGKFRDKIRCYSDTDVHGRHTGQAMGEALKGRMEMGFTFLKMDIGIRMLADVPGALCGPQDFIEKLLHGRRGERFTEMDQDERARWMREMYEVNNVMHHFTGIQVTEKGLDYMEQYVSDVRDVIGYEVPLATDHFGHIGIENCIKIARRLDKYNLAWYEDMIPWQNTEMYVRLANSCTTPICTGEDIYLKENFRPLLQSGGVSVIHPDLLSTGGILETKKIGDMAQDYGVAMALHMAESPIACMACVHAAAATENFLALENHNVDTPWWNELVTGLPNPIIQNGFITVPDKPGLGIDELNDEMIKEHIDPNDQTMWADTSDWDNNYAHDRLWS